MNVTRTYFESVDLPRDEQSLWLEVNFPDLMLDMKSGNLAVTPEAEDRLNNLAHKRVRMFVSEGAFFSLLVLTGVWFFYWALRKRIELETRTAEILSAASSGLQKPIAALRDDVGTLSEIVSANPEGRDMVNKMRYNLRMITDTCENVSLVRMFSAS